MMMESILRTRVTVSIETKAGAADASLVDAIGALSLSALLVRLGEGETKTGNNKRRHGD